MPTLDLFFQDRIDHLVLLYDRQAFKLWRLDLQRIHGSAPAANILHL